MNAPAFANELDTYTAIQDMVADRLLRPVDSATVDDFLAPGRVHLLFFAGPRSVRREAHDVAVALREVLKDYAGVVDGALVSEEAAGGLTERFRANATPCLVLLSGAEILEVIPRVRDWAEYAAAFRRYLGNAPSVASTGVTP